MFFHLSACLGRFRGDQRGSVALLFGLAAIPLMMAMGAMVDYARAAKIRGELAAICDSAVLTATTPTMMAQSWATAQTAAQNAFAASAQAINGVTYNAKSLTVTGGDTQQAGFVQRTATVTYMATVQNAFGGVDFMPQTAFTVTSSVTTSSAPNVDTYLLVDDSPSMELPATTDGVATMSGFGCAFACHENTTNDSEYASHPYKGWGTGSGAIDSYTYAENNSIPLRIDNVRDAVKNVAATANSFMTTNGANYRIAVYGFNYGFTQFQPITVADANHVPAIQASASNLIPPLMDSNNNLAAKQTYVYQTASGYKTANPIPTSPVPMSDTATDFDNAMNQINTIMPDPGSGAAGATPQGLLIIVTDGVNDVALDDSTACNASTPPAYPTYSNTYGSFTRCQEPFNTAKCTTIKNRGIRIAVLYTTYQPITGTGDGPAWYNTYVKPFISQVSQNLQACASSPTLFDEVTTGGDINAEMQTLYARAISSAPHLTQ